MIKAIVDHHGSRYMKNSSSLSTRFTTILVLLLVVGQAIGTVLYLRASSDDLTDSLHKRMQRNIRQAAGVSAEPILNFNYDLLGHISKKA